MLKLPADQLGRAIVTTDHRIAWTLDMTLEYEMAGFSASDNFDSWRGGAMNLTGSTASQGAGGTRTLGSSTLGQRSRKTRADLWTGKSSGSGPG